jgi:GAF domain-containing protein
MGAEEARRLAAEGERRRAELLEEAARREALLATAAAVQDPKRLAALRKTGLLDTPPDPSFDRHARLAAEVLNAPVALVSLIDEDRQFFKSAIGVEERETPLSHSFCQHAIASREPLIVEDAREHPLLKHNPAVEELDSVAYAGVPLIDSNGYALGTLCVLDTHPRQWTKHQVELLGDLAASVVNEITLATVEE